MRINFFLFAEAKYCIKSQYYENTFIVFNVPFLFLVYFTCLFVITVWKK